jgi:hypothetical protein
MFKDVFLLVHPTLGVLGVLAALWVFVEALKVDEKGLQRMKIASVTAALLMLLTWPAGGVWDSLFYAADREFIERGPWAFVGDTVMEVKEHLFVLVLLLALYLPILVFRANLIAERSARLATLVVAALVVLSGLAMEGAGAVLGLSVKTALISLTGG